MEHKTEQQQIKLSFDNWDNNPEDLNKALHFLEQVFLIEVPASEMTHIDWFYDLLLNLEGIIYYNPEKPDKALIDIDNGYDLIDLFDTLFSDNKPILSNRNNIFIDNLKQELDDNNIFKTKNIFEFLLSSKKEIIADFISIIFDMEGNCNRVLRINLNYACGFKKSSFFIPLTAEQFEIVFKMD